MVAKHTRIGAILLNKTAWNGPLLWQKQHSIFQQLSIKNSSAFKNHQNIVFLHDDGIETLFFCSPCWWNNEWIHFWNIFSLRYTQKQLPKAILLVELTICEERKTTLFLLHAILPCGCCCHFTMRHPSSLLWCMLILANRYEWMSSLWNWLPIRQWTQSMNAAAAAVNQQMPRKIKRQPKKIAFQLIFWHILEKKMKEFQ